MRAILKRFSSHQLSTGKSGNSLRNNPNNLYFEYIKDFTSLSPYEQEYLYHRMYLLFAACFNAFTYEGYIEYFTSLPGPHRKIMMLKEKRFNTDVGYSFYVCDEFYYKDGDTSKQNMYLSSYYVMALLPHYRGSGIGKALLDVGEYSLRNEFPDCNRVSYNTTLNAYYYSYRSELSKMMVPGPEKMPNEEPEKLLRKMMKKHDTEGISEDKPFVVNIPATINGADNKRYKENSANASKATKYFIEQTGLEERTLLANLVIYNLIEGNTLGLPAGRYEKIPEIVHEIREYKA